MTNEGIRKVLFEKNVKDEVFELDQMVFWLESNNVNWAGVDYDGTLHFGKSINPRISWASERWRGYIKIDKPVYDSGYRPLTSINRTSWRWTI